jgi:ABC-2 type transport system ATP-binding protein
MSAIITVHDLCKTFKVAKRQTGFWGGLRSFVAPQFRQVHAVDHISFTLQPGELVGYIGPNGAGKSTTVKMLTGLLVPTGGEVLVNGFIPWKERTRYVAQIGAVFGQRTTLWWDLPVIDSFNLFQSMYRIPMDRYRRNLQQFIDLLEMDAFLNTPVCSLSLGQRMRADLCAALLHEPPLLFLDEPTIGLDVVAKERIRQFIQEINRQRGTTVILTTHDLTDVEKLCERVIIIDQGSLLYDGSLDRLVAQFEQERSIEVTFAQDYVDILLPGVAAPMREGRRAAYRLPPERLTTAVQHLLDHYAIADLEVRRPELDSTIRRIYEQRLLLPNGAQSGR